MLSTIGYTSQHNGVAERANRSIIEKARCLLNESELPKSFWGETVSVAVYLINRSPTVALPSGITPAEAFYSRKPNVGRMRIFGCLTQRRNCWVFTVKRNSSGIITGCKARLVAKGCMQNDDFSYSDLYSPTAAYETVKILLPIIL